MSETGSGYTLRYYYDGAELVGFNFNNADYFYEKNLQGDITGIYNTSGTLVGSYSYDAWGKCSITYDTAYGLAFLNPFRYRGYYYDRETGLYYLNSRYYDPNTGRFINADETDNLGANQDFASLNLYTYCGNNPVSRADNGGYFWHFVARVGIGAAIGGVVSCVAKVIENHKNGNEWYEGLLRATLGGIVGGGLACISFGKHVLWLKSILFGGAGNFFGSLIAGEIQSIPEGIHDFFVGALAGWLGYKAAELFISKALQHFSSLTKSARKAFLSKFGTFSNREIKGFVDMIKNGIIPKELQNIIDDYGFETVVAALVSTDYAAVVEELDGM